MPVSTLSKSIVETLQATSLTDGFVAGRTLVESDEQQIHKLFEDGDRALIAADRAELSRIFADDYIQYDESGKSSTKREVINNLTSGTIRYISMLSTARQIRLLKNDVALVHGSEEDEVEQSGRRFQVRYIYTDVVMKRTGKWQIVASQLAKPTKPSRR
jgi:uncharacterized protein (TIGR02246 family)